MGGGCRSGTQFAENRVGSVEWEGGNQDVWDWEEEKVGMPVNQDEDVGTNGVQGKECQGDKQAASSASHSKRVPAAHVIKERMGYIDTWEEFAEKAEGLYRSNPVGTRYVTKYRHCDGKLVLKVTNDFVCLKYKTDQLQDARKMEKLNNLFLTLMSRGVDAGDMVLAEPKSGPAPPKKGRGRRQ
ncbi:hypothetical protein CBR_g18652 [Chara braunii]|uniref:Signal recognition particle 9 kDa protein n=1 Tax=Chara braunii TaxID=69332 RepID=A0A388JTE5_CHABU|nr:hypothetical protein CBR_g18652 [Chara braunii]|eukprot:GBG61060.1 hypothetical protein CBR_g18652 [Chara braunii]